jgi:hypothetical protein
MKTPTFHDVEQLSAYLDGHLPQAEISRLEIRIQSDPVLAATLADLREARTILRRTPKRRPPRNFTLTSKMAGIRPPLPRAVPVFGWSSAVAMLLFVFTLGSNLLGKFSFGAAAPMLSAAPMTGEAYGYGGGPALTQPPATDNSQMTPTPGPSALMAPQDTPQGESRVAQPPAASSTKGITQPVSIWLFLWPGLALLLAGAALLIRTASLRAFRRKTAIKRNH